MKQYIISNFRNPLILTSSSSQSQTRQMGEGVKHNHLGLVWKTQIAYTYI